MNTPRAETRVRESYQARKRDLDLAIERIVPRFLFPSLSEVTRKVVLNQWKKEIYPAGLRGLAAAVSDRDRSFLTLLVFYQLAGLEATRNPLAGGEKG